MIDENMYKFYEYALTSYLSRTGFTAFESRIYAQFRLRNKITFR